MCRINMKTVIQVSYWLFFLVYIDFCCCSKTAFWRESFNKPRDLFDLTGIFYGLFVITFIKIRFHFDHSE